MLSHAPCRERKEVWQFSVFEKSASFRGTCDPMTAARGKIGYFICHARPASHISLPVLSQFSRMQKQQAI